MSELEIFMLLGSDGMMFVSMFRKGVLNKAELRNILGDKKFELVIQLSSV